MITENIPHTYKADGIRYYAFLCPIAHIEDDKTIVDGYNFNIFDHEGYSWVEITQASMKFIELMFGFLLEAHTILEVVEAQAWQRIPLIPSDDTDGDPELGYALEMIKEKLGIDLQLLYTAKDAMEENNGTTKETTTEND